MKPSIGTRITLAVTLALAVAVKPPALAQQAEPEPRDPTPAGTQAAPSHPFLWRIETSGAKPSHVFGTIHLPSKQVINLPSVVELFEKAEVWVLATQLMVLEEQIKAPGVPFLDLLIYQSAQAARKEVGGIETVAEQLQAMNSLTEAEQISMLQATLDELDAARKLGQTAGAPLLAAYLTGSLDELDSCFRKMMVGYSPSLRRHFDEELLAKRNRRMAGRIVAKVRANPDKSHLVALGAMHYIGQDSVLELLQKEGFKIERVQP